MLSAEQKAKVPEEHKKFARALEGSKAVDASNQVHRFDGWNIQMTPDREPEVCIKTTVVDRRRADFSPDKEYWITKFEGSPLMHAIPGTGAPAPDEFENLSIPAAEDAQDPRIRLRYSD